MKVGKFRLMVSVLVLLITMLFGLISFANDYQPAWHPALGIILAISAVVIAILRSLDSSDAKSGK